MASKTGVSFKPTCCCTFYELAIIFTLLLVSRIWELPLIKLSKQENNSAMFTTTLTTRDAMWVQDVCETCPLTQICLLIVPWELFCYLLLLADREAVCRRCFYCVEREEYQGRSWTNQRFFHRASCKWAHNSFFGLPAGLRYFVSVVLYWSCWGIMWREFHPHPPRGDVILLRWLLLSED